jgi:uncharacterized protein YqgC (DUF456 family)
MPHATPKSEPNTNPIKPNSSRSLPLPDCWGAQIPTGKLLGIPKPGTNFKFRKKPAFYFFLFLFCFTICAMVYLWSTLLILLNAVWLLLVVFGLPGNWLIVISTALFAWWQADERVFSVYTLLVITVLAFLGELIEFFAGMGGARRAGAGWRGSVGALIGAVTGAILGSFLIPIPFLGTLIGACIGAGVGAWGLELFGGRKMADSVHYGMGAGIGEFFGITSKFLMGILIWLIIAVAAYWP